MVVLVSYESELSLLATPQWCAIRCSHGLPWTVTPPTGRNGRGGLAICGCCKHSQMVPRSWVLNKLSEKNSLVRENTHTRVQSQPEGERN